MIGISYYDLMVYAVWVFLLIMGLLVWLAYKIDDMYDDLKKKRGL